MSKINIDELLKVLPKLIRENDRVKGAIISALSGVVATHEDIVQLTETMNDRFERMDDRFERMDDRFNSMQQTMDDRFERMDNRFNSMLQTMNDRFNSMQQTMNNRFDRMNQNFGEVKSILMNLQETLGKPFEQFGRNVVVKILQSEGIKDITLKPRKLEDPERVVSESTTEVEIDGISIDPPIIVEITSILRDQEKIETFLRKKKFVERKYDQSFRGFFVAASSEFSAEEMGEITVKLRENHCELINL
jgi:hypothetical protein